MTQKLNSVNGAHTSREVAKLEAVVGEALVVLLIGL
jgi:hypothetical protein